MRLPELAEIPDMVDGIHARMARKHPRPADPDERTLLLEMLKYLAARVAEVGLADQQTDKDMSYTSLGNVLIAVYFAVMAEDPEATYLALKAGEKGIHSTLQRLDAWPTQPAPPRTEH